MGLLGTIGVTSGPGTEFLEDLQLQRSGRLQESRRGVLNESNWANALREAAATQEAEEEEIEEEGEEIEESAALYDISGSLIEGDIYESDLYEGEVYMEDDGSVVSEGGFLLEGIFDGQGNVLGMVEMRDGLDENDEIEEARGGMVRAAQVMGKRRGRQAMGAARRAAQQAPNRARTQLGQGRARAGSAARSAGVRAGMQGRQTGRDAMAHVGRNKARYAIGAGAGAAGLAAGMAGRRKEDDGEVEDGDLEEMMTDNYGNQFKGGSNHGGSKIHRQMGNRFQSSGQMNESNLVEELLETLREMNGRLDMLENGEQYRSELEEAANGAMIGSNGARSLLKESLTEFVQDPRDAAKLGQLVGKIVQEDRNAHLREAPGSGVGGFGSISMGNLTESADEIPDNIKESDERIANFFRS